MAKSKKPKSVCVLGKVYAIEYVSKPFEQDPGSGRVAVGKIDYMRRCIWIYDKGRDLCDLWDSILHEVLHAIAEEMSIRSLMFENTDEDPRHDDLNRLSVGLADTLIRNGWLKV